MKMNLQYFADSNDNPEETPNSEGAPNNPSAETKNPEQVHEPQQPSNTIPYERFKEVNDAYKSFKSLGYNSADELKAQLDELKTLKQAEEERKKAEMDEVERLQAEKEEAAQKAQEAEEQARKAKEAANNRILNTEIKSVARALNANDPNDVLALLDKSQIEMDEEGNVTGVEEAVTAFKESKPWLFKQAIGADAKGGSNPNTNPTVDEIAAKEKELSEAQAEALKDKRHSGKVTRIFNELKELKKKNK
ncbi:phage scaffolding protein [Virgibacillus proomii]|uniref:phage scaffolding protein n=1 Tax=Virgibacillus proomii TaxID=84407 RepID=UPI00209FB353|nr:phage scaffolding protein [Virgibacillus proomii]